MVDITRSQADANFKLMRDRTAEMAEKINYFERIINNQLEAAWRSPGGEAFKGKFMDAISKYRLTNEAMGRLETSMRNHVDKLFAEDASTGSAIEGA